MVALAVANKRLFFAQRQDLEFTGYVNTVESSFTEHQKQTTVRNFYVAVQRCQRNFIFPFQQARRVVKNKKRKLEVADKTAEELMAEQEALFAAARAAVS